MKKSIKEFNLKGKKVIIRADFNVPIKDNEILDDNRIVCSLKTINYAIENGAKVILMSHLGRIKEESDKEKNSLKIVSNRLSELLKQKVIFVPFTRGKELEESINKLNDGDVLLMENTRFEDLNNKAESGNNKELSKYWASLGEIFINDAFGTCHRAHASNVGIASNLDSGIGYLIEEEIDKLSLVTNTPKKPFTVILGGAKVNDKIGVISSLVKKADYILIGGGMAYTFLYSLGFNIGKSLLDNESIDFCKDVLSKYKDKIILPVDSICSKEMNKDSYIKSNEEVLNNDICLDIGPKTVEIFRNVLSKSETVFWNGPLGYSENDMYATGTKSILDYLSKLNITVIIGGGDTASAAINFGYKKAFTHISTGGGASLELIEGKKLPGIEVIKDSSKGN